MELQLRSGSNDVKNTAARNQIFRFSDVRLCSSQVQSLRWIATVSAHRADIAWLDVTTGIQQNFRMGARWRGIGIQALLR